MKIDRRDFIKKIGCVSLFAMGYRGLGQTSNRLKPDILLFIADDMTWHDCQPYGSTVVKTPNMAKLASEGMCFDAMFTATAMCAPTRQQLYTGLFPVRNGAYPNHSSVREGTQSHVHHLKALGYRVGLIGKRHYGPESSFPFEYLSGRDHDEGGKLDIDIPAIEPFITRDKQQPYCLIVASNQPHSPWTRKVAGISYEPETVKVPPYLVDSTVTRQKLCNYYHEITYADQQLGQCLDIVRQKGRPEQTMVLFTSEQGNQFPFGGKWTCYDNGLKTAFIVRWPKVIKPGSRTSAMAQYVDVVPTLLEAAGGVPADCHTGRPDAYGKEGFDGQSFLKVLEGTSQKLREHVYGVHTTRGIIKGSECYPIRSIRSGQYKYIWNLNWKEPFQNVITNAQPLESWRKLGEEDPAIAARARFYQYRPEEELYDLSRDPWEMTNLADDSSLAEVKAGLRRLLLEWMKQQGDEGIKTEMLVAKYGG
jgi:uncharacterized sulfatase